MSDTPRDNYTQLVNRGSAHIGLTRRTKHFNYNIAEKGYTKYVNSQIMIRSKQRKGVFRNQSPNVRWLMIVTCAVVGFI